MDYTVLDGDEPFQEPVEDAVFILGETNLLTQLREKLEGMNVGDTESFDLEFAEDDDTADPAIRGKSLAYQVTLKEIKQRDLLPLDDDFAKKVNETETLEELRQQIRTDIHVGKTNDGRTGVVNQIINAMAGQAAIDPPAVMVEEEVDHQLNHLKEDLQRSNTPWEGYLRLQGKTDDDVRDDLRPEAERRLRNSLFLQAVAKAETVEVTDQDIDGEIARLAPPMPAGGEDDDAAATQAARMAQFYQSMLRNELFERKLTDRLIEIATEGQGAVLNGYVVPEAPIDAESSVIDVESAVVDTDAAPAPEADDSAGTSDPANDAAARPGEGIAGAVRGDGSTEAPDGYPIKGNADSMIYHAPGSGSYANTVAEWHFATEEDAVNAGYRAPANRKRGADTAAAAATPDDTA